MTGKQLKAIMEREHLSVDDVAERTGYTVGNVRALLRRYELPAHAAKLLEYALGTGTEPVATGGEQQ